jgi:Subtilase family
MLGHLFAMVEKLAAVGGNPDPVFVAATGNDHPNIGMYYPAAYTNASLLAVGSIRKSKLRSSFSNFGKSGGKFALAPGGDWDYSVNSRSTNRQRAMPGAVF